MTVWVLLCGIDTEDGNYYRGVYGVYTSQELAERAAEKFIELSNEDEKYLHRSTTISEEDIDNGWFEEHWL